MFKIEIADTPHQFECAPEDTIMRSGLRAGLGMPYECNVGSCGTCKMELLSGEIEPNWPEAPGLTDRDRARKRVLGCQSRPLTDCKVKVRLATMYESAHRPRPFTGVFDAYRDITHDIREFHFRTADAHGFLPGQYALLSFSGVPGQRAYSMCNISQGDGSWHFHIRRVPGGKATGALFDQVHRGDQVAFDGPYGLAYLRTDSPRDIVCIAGGSGLSPVVSIARGVVAEPALAARKLHFFYGGRGPADICGEDMLRALPGFGERFLYYPSISMPELNVDKRWSGKVGFVHEHALEVMGKSLAEHEIYFAGPPPMAQAVQRMLAEEKVPLGQVHYDAFY